MFEPLKFYCTYIDLARHRKLQHEIFHTEQGGTGEGGIKLKLTDYLLVQADKPWCNYYTFAVLGLHILILSLWVAGIENAISCFQVSSISAAVLTRQDYTLVLAYISF